MSDGVHLLIPFASCRDDGCTEALRRLALPHLQRLLARLAPADALETGEDSCSMPHERMLARAWGLDAPDGQLPLAAWQQRQAGRDPGGDAWAWITPCHLRVGSEHLFLTPPGQLQLQEEESQALHAAMAPYFAGDGLQLAYDAPLRWVAHGEPLRGLRAAALDRAAGRSIEPWQPEGPGARTIRRLQQEMQMLLYTLPLNDDRQRRGQLPVNSFWVSGCGVLPPAAPVAAHPPLEIEDGLRDRALQGDWAGWAERWRQLDATGCARLVQEAERGRSVAVTLCGERAARTWSSAARPGVLRRLRALLQAPAVSPILETL